MKEKYQRLLFQDKEPYYFMFFFVLLFYRYTFICEEWLSLTRENCKTWVELSPLTSEAVPKYLMLSENSRRGLFDDHLWFSLSIRPNASKFTRVQRLWCIVALLFLSMVASAMWFNSNPSISTEDTNQIQTVQLGPFTLSYRMLYVGLMSSLLMFVPSFAIVFIFNNRSLRKSNKLKTIYQQHKIYDRKWLLPWWMVFVAYCSICLSIMSGGFFTFLYSLEFGSGTTNDWLLSFIMGTLQDIILLQPCKVSFFLQKKK